MKLIDIQNVSDPYSLPVYCYDRTGEASSLMTPVVDGHRYPYAAKKIDKFFDTYTTTYCSVSVSTLEWVGFNHEFN